MNKLLITPEAIAINKYILKTWHNFRTEMEVRLNKIFPEPENKGLKHIWRYGSADIVVYRKDNNKLVALIEPGGAVHMQEEKQKKNDARKWKLCDIHGVKCLHIMNGAAGRLSKRKMRSLIGSCLF